MLDWVGHAEIALHAHPHEEEGAEVDATVKQEVHQRAKEIREVPDVILSSFHHLERQEEKKEKVGQGQVEQEDVYGDRLLAHFPQEGVAGQEVGREAYDKGKDVDG